jgi:catechol-2,3-dioxygenase
MKFINNIQLFKLITFQKFLLLLTLVFTISCKKNIDPLSFPEKEVVIKELIINGNQAEFFQIRNFWENTIGCEVVNQTFNTFTIKIGTSLLTFKPNFTTLSRPQYHFSILIPSNQIENCLAWLKNGGKKKDGKSIQLWKGGVTNAEIIQSPLYNSSSVYFADYGGNIIELVARRNLENSEEGEFSPEMFKEINSVSMVTKEVKAAQKLITDSLGYQPVDRTTSGYKVMGNANGLINILVQSRIIPPTTTEQAYPYEMELVVQNPDSIEVPLPGYFVKITTRP